MAKKPSAAELDERLTQARTKLDAVRSAHAAARQRYVAELGTAAENSAELTRLRKGVRQAEHDIEEASERVAAIEAIREVVTAEDAAADLARRWNDARNAGRQWLAAVEDYESAQRYLVEAFASVCAAGEKFRDGLPTQFTASEQGSLLYNAVVFERRARVALYGASAGKFNTGGLMSSPYEIANGPTLTALAKDTLERAMAREVKVAASAPEPEVAQ